MNKILKLSNTGFQVEFNNSTKWFTLDKFKVLMNPQYKAVFDSLEVGDYISFNSVNRKDRDYVLSLSLVKKHGLECDGMSSSPLNSVQDSSTQDILASDKDRNILKGQCLNIAFRDVDVSDSKFRELGIRNAQKLFRELEDANYYRW